MRGQLPYLFIALQLRFELGLLGEHVPTPLALFISVFTSAAGVAFSIYSYMLNRRRDIAWKKTEFLYTQGQYLDSDSDLMEAVRIIEGRHPDITMAEIFGGTEFDEIKKNESLQKIDKLLSFLRRLCYSHLQTRIISLKEIQEFEWYFWRIAQSPSAVKYCHEHGFEEINVVINRLERRKRWVRVE
jgi:hypothetical protein